MSAYADRREAGLVLADRLRGEHIEGGVVVGLARGGVVVAAEVARRLGLPLDALAVRKVRHPLQPEYGIGAVTPAGDASFGRTSTLLPRRPTLQSLRRGRAPRRSIVASTLLAPRSRSRGAHASWWTMGSRPGGR